MPSPWMQASSPMRSPQNMIMMADGSMNGPGIVNGSVSGDIPHSLGTFPPMPSGSHTPMLGPSVGMQFPYNTTLAALARPPAGNNAASPLVSPAPTPAGLHPRGFPLQSMQRIAVQSISAGGSPSGVIGGSSSASLFAAYTAVGPQVASGAWQGFGAQHGQVTSRFYDTDPVVTPSSTPAARSDSSDPAALFNLSKQ